MWLPAPPRAPGTNGRPRKHGRELALSGQAARPDPQITTSTATTRYGIARAAAWDQVHPRLTHRAAWLHHDGPLPVIEETLIRLQVDYLPGDRDPKPAPKPGKPGPGRPPGSKNRHPASAGPGRPSAAGGTTRSFDPALAVPSIPSGPTPAQAAHRSSRPRSPRADH
jgi:hypothetical protein